MFFKKKNELMKKEISSLNQHLSRINEWLFYFYNQNNQLVHFSKEHQNKIERQEDELDEIALILKNMPKTKEDFRRLVDSYYSFDNIMDRLRAIEVKFDYFEEKTASQQKNVSVQSPKSSIKEKVLRKIARSSKDYIRNLVLSLVNKYNKVSALQLREIIVEEQGLCSKSSFYRVLEELEREDLLNVVSKGKIKVFVDTPGRKSTIPEQ